jgi:hypothetical protein
MKTWMSRVLILSAPLTLAASWDTTAFRTPTGGLVRVGMTAAEARHELGPAASPRQSGKSKKNAEVWSIRGSDGLYTITISGGQVRKITVAPDRD